MTAALDPVKIVEPVQIVEPGTTPNPEHRHPSRLDLRVTAVTYESELVRSYELRDPEDKLLPPFVAGAHIDLLLPNGLERSYSLCNSPTERDRYVVGVQRDPASRGGSVYIHDHIDPGTRLTVVAPSNNFELVDDPAPVVLIAGGIGVTPLVSMARVLQAENRRWRLFYAVRERAQISFGRELRSLVAAGTGELHIHVDAEAGGVLDLAAVIAGADEGTHFYCCGPAPMLAGFSAAAAGLPDDRVHVEYFTNDQAPDTAGGYTVEVASTGLVVTVPPGRTILETLEAADVPVEFSCTEGVCGTCETRVLAGVPDHRDMVLSDREKAVGDVMMICCSGSKTDHLVLDL